MPEIKQTCCVNLKQFSHKVESPRAYTLECLLLLHCLDKDGIISLGGIGSGPQIMLAKPGSQQLDRGGSAHCLPCC